MHFILVYEGKNILVWKLLGKVHHTVEVYKK